MLRADVAGAKPVKFAVRHRPASMCASGWGTTVRPMGLGQAAGRQRRPAGGVVPHPIHAEMRH